MERRKAVWYSLIRYSHDELTGEVINVGLILHVVERAETRYFLLNENSPKLRYIIGNKSGLNLYKSYKDVLGYYLDENKELSGAVGNVIIGSCFEEGFLQKLFNHYGNKKLSLTEPNFAYTEDINMLYESLFKLYIGEQYFNSEPNTISAKKYAKEIFKKKNLIGTKIRTDYELNPIRNLNDVKIKVDFSFKNGVWNYMEALPILSGPAQNSEWFAKMQLMLNSLEEKDSKIHLLYKSSDLSNNGSVLNIIAYLTENNQRVNKVDFDEKNQITQLCNYIEKEAEDIEDYIAS